ncbi:MAG: hypothetical protein HC902_03720 [Calothrix sp. SM1_5_4]|nr:hypothetical protein [Calothrix sp. SM1_5_4]
MAAREVRSFERFLAGYKGYIVGLKLRFQFFILLLLLVSGCATMDGLRQSVLVASSPAGAKIYNRGRLIGTTPGYVLIRRERRPKLSLAFPDGKTRELDLSTKYRWGDSFWGNVLFLSYAPVGWGVDLATGAAWRILDPQKMSLPGTAEGGTMAVRRVAVAPPLVGDAGGLSDALGSMIQKKLSDLRRFEVLDYEVTAPVFEYFNSEQGISDRPEDAHSLYGELGVDHVFISRAEAKGEGYLIEGDLVDVFSRRPSSKFAWEVRPESDELKSDLGTYRLFNERFHWLPNSLFLNISQYQPNLMINEANYAGTSQRGHKWDEELLNYVSFISLSHMERPRRRSGASGSGTSFQRRIFQTRNSLLISIRHCREAALIGGTRMPDTVWRLGI